MPSTVEEQASASQEITRSIQVASTAVDKNTTNLDSIAGEIDTTNTFTADGTEMYRSLQIA